MDTHLAEPAQLLHSFQDRHDNQVQPKASLTNRRSCHSSCHIQNGTGVDVAREAECRDV